VLPGLSGCQNRVLLLSLVPPRKSTVVVQVSGEA
jgi:hypothetical protein